jgi:Domain of unknown function, B. Theta Gene description (DUF3871)
MEDMLTIPHGNHTSMVSFEPIFETSTEQAFILANTIPVALQEIDREHIIPVFVKDNEPLISHVDFIQAVEQVVHHVFEGEQILGPSVRVSHAVKGRIPEARHKPAKELLKHEETLYYERCAFVIELPHITEMVNGNSISLTIGGVKAYNADNLYNRKGADEHFKVFIGFQNKVCTNLCVWSDGFVQDLRAKSVTDICNQVFELLTTFKPEKQIGALRRLGEFSLTEPQFAKLVGRTRMYQFLPNPLKKELPKFLFPDGHLNTVVRDYYNDVSFCRTDDGNISLWRLYNLFSACTESIIYQ